MIIFTEQHVHFFILLCKMFTNEYNMENGMETMIHAIILNP